MSAHYEVFKNYCESLDLYNKDIEKALFKADSNSILELKNLLNLNPQYLHCLHTGENILMLIKLDAKQIKYLAECLNNLHVRNWLFNTDNTLSFLRLDLNNMGIVASLINNFVNLHFEHEVLIKEFLNLDIIKLYEFIQQSKQLNLQEVNNPFILLDILKKIK